MQSILNINNWMSDILQIYYVLGIKKVFGGAIITFDYLRSVFS